MAREFKGPWIYPTIEHNRDTAYGWRVAYPGQLKLGAYTDIGYGTYINAIHGVEIGEGTMIGGQNLIYSQDDIGNRSGPVVIGKNCRIGAHCLILPGAHIKDGTFIKAFSWVDSRGVGQR